MALHSSFHCIGTKTLNRTFFALNILVSMKKLRETVFFFMFSFS